MQEPFLIVKAHTGHEHIEGADHAIIALNDSVGDALWQTTEDAIYVGECLLPAPDYLEWRDYCCTWVRYDPSIEEYDFYRELEETGMVLVKVLPRCWAKTMETFEHALFVRSNGDRRCVHLFEPTEVWWASYLHYSDYPVSLTTERVELRELEKIQVFEGVLYDGAEDDWDDAWAETNG